LGCEQPALSRGFAWNFWRRFLGGLDDLPMRSTTFFAVFCLMGLILVLFTGCGKQEPIRIGFVAGISGKNVDLGVGGRNGALFAVEQINAAGGVNGRPIELIIRDDQQSTLTARAVTQELIQMKVDAIIGPFTSSIAMEMVPLVNQARTILISPTVTTTQLTGKDDYFFRVCGTTEDYARKNARYSYEKRGFRKAAVIYDMGNRTYTESWLRSFQKTFEEQGGQIVKTVPFSTGPNLALTPLIPQLLDARPDFILIISNVVDSSMIAQQVRKLDPVIPLSMSEWASTNRLIELGGQAVEGAQVCQFLNRQSSSPHYQNFVKGFDGRFKQEVGFFTVCSYDCVFILSEAFSRCGRKENLKETLLKDGPFQGCQFPIQFDSAGDTVRDTYISLIQNGQYMTVE
jgi:branched-chain amino acid transport system substrate-binding protein